MLRIQATNTYEKELKLMLKRGKNFNKLLVSLNLIRDNANNGIEHHLLLPEKYRLHKLGGKYTGYWEYHIEPDWLLIFYLDAKVMILERTGTHSDLMNKIKR
jgi:mRNA interferase YafQ